jgi:hypothetical protein
MKKVFKFAQRFVFSNCTSWSKRNQGYLFRTNIFLGTKSKQIKEEIVEKAEKKKNVKEENEKDEEKDKESSEESSEERKKDEKETIESLYRKKILYLNLHLMKEYLLSKI